MPTFSNDFNSNLQHNDFKYVNNGHTEKYVLNGSNGSAGVDSAIQNQVNDINTRNTSQPNIHAINTKTPPTLSNSTESLTNPTILQGIKGTLPSAWISAQPQVNPPVMNGSVVHIFRNILGDAAWPPVRPPSSGPQEFESRVQTNQGVATTAALEAWRSSLPPVGEQDLAAAFADLLQMTAPKPTEIQVPPAMPHPLNIEPPPHVPRSIDLELLRDPEAEVSSFPRETVPLPHHATVRYYTNAEANTRGALTEQPRKRQVREHTEDKIETECSKTVSTCERVTRALSSLVPSPAKLTVPQVVARPEFISTAVIRSVASTSDGRSSVGSAIHPVPVAKAAPVRLMAARTVVKTPIDERYLGLVLDGRLMPDDKEKWISDALKRLTSQDGPPERPTTRSSKEGRNGPEDLQILQELPPLAQPEGGGGGDPRDAQGPGISDNLERLVSGDHGPHSSTSPGGKLEVGLRSDVSCGCGPPVEPMIVPTPVSCHEPSITHGQSILETAAQVQIPGDMALPHSGGGRAARSRSLIELAGSEYLRKGRAISKGCWRWTARVGVSLNADGSLTARILEGIASARREPYVLPYSGNIVGNVWNIALERIVSGTEQMEDALETEDARVLGILNGPVMGERMDDIQSEAAVHDERSMQQVLSSVLRLLRCVPQSGGGHKNPADLRIPQDFPPLALPEGGVRGNPRDAQGPGISDDLQQHAPPRSGATPSSRTRAQFTLRDYLPGARAPGSLQRLQGAAPSDPVAWRAAILADNSAGLLPISPLQHPREALKVQQRPRSQPPRVQPRVQPLRPGTADACVRLSVEPPQQPVLPQQRTSPRLTAPIPCRNFFGPLAESSEDPPEEADLRHQQLFPARPGGTLLFERQTWQRRQMLTHGSQPPSRSGRRSRQRKVAAKVDGSIERPASAGIVAAQQASRPPAADRPGVLSNRPEFLDQLSSATGCTWSPPLPRRGGCGWSVPRPRSRSVASALHALAKEGPTSSRFPEFHRDHGAALWDSERAGPLSVRMVSGMQSLEVGASEKGGTAHRTVLWGRPCTTDLGDEARASRGQISSAISASQQLAGAPVLGRQSTGLGSTGQHCAGRPSAVRCKPSLEIPERGGGTEARDGQGSGNACRNRMRSTPSSMSSSARRDPDLAQDWGTVSAPSCSGAALRPPQVQLPSESHVVVRRGQQQHTVSITQADWDGFDHLRHGASPDLVVALCLRQHLGCTRLVCIELVSHEALILPRGDWPASWEEFGSFITSGGSFRVGALLRGGMDPARKALLDAVQFGSDTDWDILDRCLEAVRQQAPLPAEAGQGQRTLAELMSEASPLRQWALMEAVPGIQGRCNATPARMTALGLILARPLARVRLLPPCVAAGQAGQHVELRFNSIPPPPTPTAGSSVSADSIKDGVLGKLQELAPEMWTDDAFALRTVRKSMRLEGNLSALQVFSLTVLLPFGNWIIAFLGGQLSLGPGSYATVAPYGTHVEVELTPLDHAVFRAIRLSLGLNHADGLALLEDGLTRALRGPVACRFTTSRRIVSGGGGGGGVRGKPSYVHHSPDDEGASTLFTIEAASLVVARRQDLHIRFSLGDGDDQRPIALKFQLPVCPPGALYRMVESRVTPPLRVRAAGTLFLHPNVLIGPLAANWMTDKIVHSSSEEERLRRAVSSVWRGCVQAADIHFVGKRDKGDKNPIFLYVEFSSLEAARTFGTNLDSRSFRSEFIGFWNTWIGDRPVSLWSCALLTEALEVVSFKAWRGLMELGMQSPCLPPDPAPADARAV